MSESQIFIKNDKQGDSFRRLELQGDKIVVFRVKVEVPIDNLCEGREEEIERGEVIEEPFTVSELLTLGWSDPQEWGIGVLSEEDIIHIGVRLDTDDTYYRAGNGYAWSVLGLDEALHLICYGKSDLAMKEFA